VPTPTPTPTLEGAQELNIRIAKRAITKKRGFIMYNLKV